MTEGNIGYDTTGSSLLFSHKIKMDKRDCARIIDYYRIKIESFDKERIEMLEKLEGLRIAQEDFQKTQWELQKRSDEVYEVQKALAETNNALNYERRQVINLTAELESYKLKVKEDRIRMIKLLKLTEPIEQTVKLFQDRRPQMFEKFSNSNTDLETEEIMSNSLAKTVRMTSRANRSFYNENATSPSNSVNKNRGMSSSSSSFYTKSQANSNKNLFNRSCNNFSFNNSKNKNEILYKNFTSTNCAKTNCSRSNSKKTNSGNNNLKSSFRSSSNKTYSPRLEMRIPPRDEKQQIIRTIIMPGDKSNSNTNSTLAASVNDNSINEENDFLRKQLLEMRNYYENLFSKIEEDNKLKEEEEKLKTQTNKQTIEDLTQKNNKLEKNTYEITKDYMQLKYDFNKNEKNLFEEIETLKLQVEALTFTLDDVVKKYEIERTSARLDYERKTKEISSVMRNQVKKHEENISIIKEQYKQIQKIYVAKVNELEEKLITLTDKLKISEKQKNYENEGYKNEINLMRKRVKSFEEFVVKLRKLTYGLTDKSNKIHDALKSEQEKFFSELNDFNGDLDLIEEKLRTENINKTNTIKASQRSRSQSQSKNRGKDSQSSNKI